MPRQFAAVSHDTIAVGLGRANFAFGPGSIALIFRMVTLPSTQFPAIFLARSSPTLGYGILVHNDGHLNSWINGSSGHGPVLSAGVWYVGGFSKATGTVRARFHLFTATTGVWQHFDEVDFGAQPNSTVPTGPPDIGADLAAGVWPDMILARLAVYDKVLSDSQWEQLPVSIVPWISFDARLGLEFDQAATSTRVADWTGGGANQVTISGTSISSLSAPFSRGGTRIRRRQLRPLATGLPSATASPVVAPSAPVVGSLLQASAGTWTNSPTAYDFQWQRSTDGVTWANVSGDPTPALVPAGPALALPHSGVSTGPGILTANSTVRTKDMDEMQAAGAKLWRIESFNDVGGQSALDTLVPMATTRSIETMLVLYGKTGPRTLGSDTFPAAQAAKWLGTVDFFEIASEPDVNGWTPNQYADFVADCYDALISGNSNAIVIAGGLWKGATIGGTTYTTQNYVTALCTRAAGKFHYLSMHLYDDPLARAPWNIWDMAYPWTGGFYNGNTCREILDAQGFEDVPIIASEAGGPVLTGYYTEPQQATIVQHALQQVAAHKLASCCIFQMVEYSAGYGMLRPADFSRRPSWTAYQTYKVA